MRGLVAIGGIGVKKRLLFSLAGALLAARPDRFWPCRQVSQAIDLWPILKLLFLPLLRAGFT